MNPDVQLLRLSPNANESSFPLNQRAIIVVMATIIDSAPSPNISLPVAIRNRSPLRAVTTAPIIISIVKIRTDFLVPILSIINPPTKYHYDIRETVYPLQQSYVRIGKLKLFYKQICQRTYAVINIIVAEHCETDKYKNSPPEERQLEVSLYSAYYFL